MTTCDPYDVSQIAKGASDAQCPKDWPTLQVQQSVASSVTFTVTDPGLASIDFVTSSSSNSPDNPEGQYVRLIFREYYGGPGQVVVGERISADTFLLYFESSNVSKAGVFLGDLILYKNDGHTSEEIDDPNNVQNVTITNVPDGTATMDDIQVRPIWYKRIYLEIEPSITNAQGPCDYPLSIAEVRLSLRDSCPAGNFLIDDYEYTDKEIYMCIHRVVDLWNESPPPVATFSYISFPYRYHWTQAVMGLLLMSAARHKLRNWLPAQGGGITINDQSIWREYHNIGQQYMEEFKDWMLRKKVEINIAGAYGGFSGGVTNR